VHQERILDVAKKKVVQLHSMALDAQAQLSSFHCDKSKALMREAQKLAAAQKRQRGILLCLQKLDDTEDDAALRASWHPSRTGELRRRRRRCCCCCCCCCSSVRSLALSLLLTSACNIRTDAVAEGRENIEKIIPEIEQDLHSATTKQETLRAELRELDCCQQMLQCVSAHHSPPCTRCAVVGFIHPAFGAIVACRIARLGWPADMKYTWWRVVRCALPTHHRPWMRMS
jgi:hypothetical protein